MKREIMAGERMNVGMGYIGGKGDDIVKNISFSLIVNDKLGKN